MASLLHAATLLSCQLQRGVDLPSALQHACGEAYSLCQRTTASQKVSTPASICLSVCLSVHILYMCFLFSSLNHKLVTCIQRIENAGAWVWTQARQHITSILASLHWLLMWFRIDFKILLKNLKAFHGQAHNYILVMFSPCEPQPSLKSYCSKYTLHYLG